MLLEELPPIQRYLNRLLALPIEMQNALFSAFTARIEAQTEMARAAGTLDVGIETLRADRIHVSRARRTSGPARAAGRSRAPSRWRRRRSCISPPGRTFWRYTGIACGPMRNAASGKVALISKRAFQVYDDDVFTEMRDLRRPTGRSSLTEDAFAASRWERIDKAEFITLWDAESEALPKVEVETLVLLTGLLLPIWKSIPSDNERIWRVEPEGRGSLIGRAITTDQALVLKGRFSGAAPETADELVATVLSGEGTADLGRGLTLRARRVAGARRLELEGVAPDALPSLKAAGCFTEIIAHQLRVFVPTGAEASAVIERVRAGRAAPSAA